MSVISVQLRKQSVPGSKKAFSLVLSAVFLTVILGSSVIGLAQEEVKATAQKAPCSAEKDQADAGQCTKVDDSMEGTQPQAGKPITIYNTIGPPSKPFDTKEATPVGPGSGSTTQAVGIPFTPSENVNLEGIELPIYWHSGLDSVEVCIYTDTAGFPGISVECTFIYDMYPWGQGFLFPTCIWEWPRPFHPWPCVCYNVWGWNPFALTAGTRYWVVVYPDPNEPDFFGYLPYTTKRAQGPVAFMDTTGTWNVENTFQFPVGIFGK